MQTYFIFFLIIAYLFLHAQVVMLSRMQMDLIPSLITVFGKETTK